MLSAKIWNRTRHRVNVRDRECLMDWKKLYHFIEWWTGPFSTCQFWAKTIIVFDS